MQAQPPLSSICSVSPAMMPRSPPCGLHYRPANRYGGLPFALRSNRTWRQIDTVRGALRLHDEVSAFGPQIVVIEVGGAMIGGLAVRLASPHHLAV